MADSQQLVHDLENRSGDKQPKAIMAGDEYVGQPTIVVTEEEIILSDGGENVVNVNSKYGVLLSGKLSLSAMPDQVSFGGGYWRFNPMLLSCLPSTTPTPIPVLVKDQPELLKGGQEMQDAFSFLMGFSDVQL